MQKQLNDINDAGTYKTERIITSPQHTSITVEGSSGKMLNFCANNYLGLSVRIWSNKMPIFAHSSNNIRCFYFVLEQQRDCGI